MNRRKFLTFMGTAGVASALGTAKVAEASHTFPYYDNGYGVLHDMTRCIGCRKCEEGCNKVNNLKKPDVPFSDLTVTHKHRRMTPNEWTVVNRWDMGNNEFFFRKQQCFHCNDPACASACFTKCYTKNPDGSVTYDGKQCVGCRYCMVACPYNVPKYDYNNPFGALHKCELCNQKGVERLDKGGLPGCVEVCPAGAVIFGTREELMAEAKKRLALKPGSEYHYPRQTLKSGDTYLHTVPKYYPHLYGEKEGGGTQVLVLTGVPYENLDLPKLDDLSTGARSEHVQHTLYKGMMLPLAVLAGLTVLVRRNTKNDHHDGGDDHES
mgnify:CR=1 FL=1